PRLLCRDWRALDRQRPKRFVFDAPKDVQNVPFPPPRPAGPPERPARPAAAAEQARAPVETGVEMTTGIGSHGGPREPVITERKGPCHRVNGDGCSGNWTAIATHHLSVNAVAITEAPPALDQFLSDLEFLERNNNLGPAPLDFFFGNRNALEVGY